MFEEMGVIRMKKGSKSNVPKAKIKPRPKKSKEPEMH